MAQQYLTNQNRILSNLNANILNDIQKLSAYPLDPGKLATVSASIDGYGRSLYESNNVLLVLQKNSNLFNANDIDTFSRNLLIATNNLQELQGCSAVSFNGILCKAQATSTTSGTSSGTSSGTTSGTSSGTSSGTTSGTSTGTSSGTSTADSRPIRRDPYIDPNAISAEEAGLLTFTGGNREFFQGYSSFNSIYGGMPIIEGLAQMDDEKLLIEKLNAFNLQYARYLKCNDKWNNADCTASEKCTTPITLSSCEPLRSIISAAADINRSITTIKHGTINNNMVSRNGDYNIPSGAALTPDQYETNYNSILDNHKKVAKLRNELDVKVQSLYNPEKSISADYKKSFDATIYSGILISALATSVLFYTFNHL